MSSYIPPHKRKRNASKSTSRKNIFNDNWVLEEQSSNKNVSLTKENFPSLSKQDENTLDVNKKTNIDYKKVTDIFKKKRLLREKKNKKLPPGWIKLTKGVKYKKTDIEKDYHYETVQFPNLINNMLNKQEEYYQIYEERTGEDIRYYVTESETESEIDTESESDQEYSNEEYYEEEETYLKKYNRN